MGTAILVAAILVKFPISKVFVALKSAFTADTIDAPSLVEVTIPLAKKSRKGGLLAQEGVNIDNKYFTKGIQLCVDGLAETVEAAIAEQISKASTNVEERESEGIVRFPGKCCCPLPAGIHACRSLAPGRHGLCG